MIEILVTQIPLLRNGKEIIRINKGYSSDEKYQVQMDDGKKLLLRTFKLEDLASKKTEFSILEKMKEYQVLCSEPIAIGEVGNQGYMITSFLEGRDGEDEIPTYSYDEQYKIGVAAGQELRKMHLYSAPAYISSWYERKVEKHERYIKAYLACGVKVKHDQKIMSFIEENIHLMKSRPNLFQHDDFHPSNIVVDNKEFAGVIDFNRYDWGDPIHEFLKIGIFSRQTSVPFSIGQIKGYFDNKNPDELFWRLYSLYMAMTVFSSVVWTLNTIPNELEDMLAKVYQFLEDHDYFSLMKPKWYID